jgi:hypothetical protein
VISRIEARIANFTYLPAVHQEEMQVLKYEFGQKYEAHWVGKVLKSGHTAVALPAAVQLSFLFSFFSHAPTMQVESVYV